MISRTSSRLFTGVATLAIVATVGCSSDHERFVGAARFPSSSGASRGAAGASPSTVTVEVRRGPSVATVRRELTGDAAQKLVADTRALTVAQPGGVNCLTDNGFRDVITVPDQTGSLVFTVKPEPCGSITETGTGKVRRLDGAAELDRAVLAALGLPSSYGTK